MIGSDERLESIRRRIEAQIDEYRQKETEARLSRLALEKTLLEIIGDNQAPSLASAPPFAPIPAQPAPTAKRKRHTEEILSILKRSMLAGGTFQLAELIAKVEGALGKQVPASTVRSILQRDGRFENVGYGKYRISKTGIQEIKGQP